jgi:arginyl-tRNA synthetase
MGPKSLLRDLLRQALEGLEVPEIPLQETPEGHPGDYGTPLAFTLARRLRRSPEAIARELQARLPQPPWLKAVHQVGGYLNFELDPAFLLQLAAAPLPVPPPAETRILIEHTSVNPNKELHVGHLRNICLGDALARILRYSGHPVRVLNYIDDTGRQVAESLYALERYGLEAPEGKYDHWVGKAYVRLHGELQDPSKAAEIEAQVQRYLHRLEGGELREAVARIVAANLETMLALGARYDLLVWESDLLQAGLLAQALKLFEGHPEVTRPQEGKYAGALIMDVRRFFPELEDPYVVLLRSNGTATYTAKDIAFQFWKMGLLQGLRFRPYGAVEGFTLPELWTSAPQGEALEPFLAQETINTVDVRQAFPQAVLRAALEIAGYPELAQRAHHLAYETVLLEGAQMSGRRGHTVSIDEVLQEARERALKVVREKNPQHPDPEGVARAVGLAAIRFAMVRIEPKKQIDFRLQEALSLEGDTGPYIQYAQARAASLLKRAEEEGLEATPDFTQGTAYERRLGKEMLRFSEVVAEAATRRSPHLLAQYLLSLASTWNAYYNAKDAQGPATPVLTAPPGLRGLRLALIRQLREELRLGLELLGIEAPASM